MAIIKRKNFIFGGPKTTNLNYIPIDNSTLATTTYLANRIGYFPIYIYKNIYNPNFCIEITTAGNAGGLPIGIYNGFNGLSNAPLIWSGFLNYGGPTGIYKTSAPISLQEGFYILASCSNITGAVTYTARAPGIKYTKSLFGDSTTSIANSFNTTSAFESTGVNLPLVIDGNISGSYSVIAPIVTIEY